jgi:hypothetical protein
LKKYHAGVFNACRHHGNVLKRFQTELFKIPETNEPVGNIVGEHDQLSGDGINAPLKRRRAQRCLHRKNSVSNTNNSKNA